MSSGQDVKNRQKESATGFTIFTDQTASGFKIECIVTEALMCERRMVSASRNEPTLWSEMTSSQRGNKMEKGKRRGRRE